MVIEGLNLLRSEVERMVKNNGGGFVKTSNEFVTLDAC